MSSLLQFGTGIQYCMYRIDGRLKSGTPVSMSHCWDTTHSNGFESAAVIQRWDNARRGSLARAVASERYRRRSKVPSEWSETIRRVQRQKGA